MCFCFRSERNYALKAPWAVFQTVWTCAPVMVAPAVPEILGHAGIMGGRVRLANENVDVEEAFHWGAGSPSC